MPRPVKCRWVSYQPEVNFFKPAGIPMRELETTTLSLDEVEAIRLADYEGLYQEEAAERMKISRQTFGNIVSSARRKIADAVINGKAIRIEGGVVNFFKKGFICKRCGHKWYLSKETEKIERCPDCHSEEVNSCTER